jgi:hypothetical protein
MTIFNKAEDKLLFHSESLEVIIAFAKMIAAENKDNDIVFETRIECRDYIRQFCENLTVCHADSGYEEFDKHNAVDTGKMDLTYIESPHGYHFAIDNSYADQVGEFKIILPTGEIYCSELNLSQA